LSLKTKKWVVFENKKCVSYLLVYSSLAVLTVSLETPYYCTHSRTCTRTHTAAIEESSSYDSWRLQIKKLRDGRYIGQVSVVGGWVGVGGWVCKEQRVASAYRARAIMPSVHVCVLAQSYTITNPRTHTPNTFKQQGPASFAKFLTQCTSALPPRPQCHRMHSTLYQHVLLSFQDVYTGVTSRNRNRRNRNQDRNCSPICENRTEPARPGVHFP